MWHTTNEVLCCFGWMTPGDGHAVDDVDRSSLALVRCFAVGLWHPNTRAFHTAFLDDDSKSITYTHTRLEIYSYTSFIVDFPLMGRFGWDPFWIYASRPVDGNHKTKTKQKTKSRDLREVGKEMVAATSYVRVLFPPLIPTSRKRSRHMLTQIEYIPPGPAVALASLAYRHPAATNGRNGDIARTLFPSWNGSFPSIRN